MKKLIDKTLFKFILVGIVNTLFGTAVMFAFYNILHLNYWMSSMANYLFGSILSYFLNKTFTFKNTETGIKPVIRFVINIVVCYTLAYGIAKPIVRITLSSLSKTVVENCAMLVGTVLFLTLNYIGQRFFAFKNKE